VWKRQAYLAGSSYQAAGAASLDLFQSCAGFRLWLDAPPLRREATVACSSDCRLQLPLQRRWQAAGQRQGLFSNLPDHSH